MPGSDVVFCFASPPPNREGQFSCGHVESKSSSRSFLSPRTGNNSNSRDNTSFNLSDQLTWDYDDDNMTQFYDYYDSFVNDSASSEIPSASSAETRVRSLNSSFSVAPDDNQTNSSASEDFSNFLSWAFFPTLPTITEQKNTDKRIVGGNEAPPGGIPWQVAWNIHKIYDLFFCLLFFSFVWLRTFLYIYISK